MNGARGTDPILSRGRRTVLSERGQSTLIGLVLLIGMVAAGSLGIFLVAGDMLTDVEQQSEHDRVEGAFVELSQQMATASANDDVSRSMDLEVGDDGAVVMSDTGNLRIQGGDVDKNISIGAIEYTGDDGTKIAYQAGGVFRETGNQTRVASAPPIEYDADSETLEFPIIKTRDEAHLDSGEVRMTHHETDPLQDASLVTNDTVTLEVTSDYYRGWEEYFENQGGATAVQGVELHEGDQGTVTAEFGFREISDAFRSGAIYANEFNERGSVDYDDEQVTSASYPALDDEIYRTVNQTDDEDDEFRGENVEHFNSSPMDEHESLDDGVYYAEGIAESGHLDFNLTDGDATLVVNGSIQAQNDTITVSDYEDGNDLSVYVTGNYDASNGGQTCVAVEGCYENETASVIQMAVTSESKVTLGPGGNARYEGVIYAGGSEEDYEQRHGCDSQVCMLSNPSFYGSVVGSSIEVGGGEGSLDFGYDEDLEDAEFSIYPDPDMLPPQITYLTVAEHKVDVDGN